MEAKLENHLNNEDSSGYLTLSDILVILKRSWKIITASTIFCLTLTSLFLFFERPEYTAKNALQINVKSQKILNIEAVVSSMSSDDAAIISELDILKSRPLAERVIQQLNLDKDPEFTQLSPIKALINSIKTIVGLNTRKVEPNLNNEQKILFNDKIVNNFLAHLQVIRKPRSYTISIEFSSTSPSKAQRVVNTLADVYIASQLESKYGATRHANQWLSDKLVELQRSLQESEARVQRFREENNLVSSGRGGTINDQQLAEINSQLVIARAARAQAEAKLANAKKSIESTPEVLSSGLIQMLRSQETELLRKKADLSNRYGPKHPKMINLAAEADDLKTKTNAEIAKIIVSMENEVEVVKNRELSLSDNLDELKGTTELNSRASLQLAELEREVSANKGLYEAFLNRFKQTSETSGTEQADAKIISYAQLPLTPSYPKKSIFLVIGFIVGLLIGIILAFVIESIDNSFRSSAQLEKLTGIRVIGMLPERRKNDDKNSSIFYEALKTVMMSMNLETSGKKIRRILITSSTPEEG